MWLPQTGGRPDVTTCCTAQSSICREPLPAQWRKRAVSNQRQSLDVIHQMPGPGVEDDAEGQAAAGPEGSRSWERRSVRRGRWVAHRTHAKSGRLCEKRARQASEVGRRAPRQAQIGRELVHFCAAGASNAMLAAWHLAICPTRAWEATLSGLPAVTASSALGSLCAQRRASSADWWYLSALPDGRLAYGRIPQVHLVPWAQDKASAGRGWPTVRLHASGVGRRALVCRRCIQCTTASTNGSRDHVLGLGKAAQPTGWSRKPIDLSSPQFHNVTPRHLAHPSAARFVHPSSQSGAACAGLDPPSSRMPPARLVR